MEDRVCYTVNADGYVTWIAMNVHDVFGWKQDEVIGRHFFDFIPAEDHAQVLENRKHRDPGRTDEYFTHIISKDGRQMPVRIKVLQTPENTVGYIDRRLSDRKVDREDD